MRLARASRPRRDGQAGGVLRAWWFTSRDFLNARHRTKGSTGAFSCRERCWGTCRLPTYPRLIPLHITRLFRASERLHGRNPQPWDGEEAEGKVYVCAAVGRVGIFRVSGMLIRHSDCNLSVVGRNDVADSPIRMTDAGAATSLAAATTASSCRRPCRCAGVRRPSDMKTFLDCIPCLIRQSLDSVRLVTADERIHEQILREVLQAAGRMDFKKSPPAIGQEVHRRIRQLCGDEDPYRQGKDRFNRLAMGLRPGLQCSIEQADNPLEAAVRLAIAGNVMDLAVKSSLSEAQVQAVID